MPGSMREAITDGLLAIERDGAVLPAPSSFAAISFVLALLLPCSRLAHPAEPLSGSPLVKAYPKRYVIPYPPLG